MIDGLRSMGWLPRHVWSPPREIERASVKLEQRLHRTPTGAEMALELGCSVHDFHESLLTMSYSSMVALDELWKNSED